MKGAAVLALRWSTAEGASFAASEGAEGGRQREDYVVSAFALAKAFLGYYLYVVRHHQLPREGARGGEEPRQRAAGGGREAGAVTGRHHVRKVQVMLLKEIPKKTIPKKRFPVSPERSDRTHSRGHGGIPVGVFHPGDAANGRGGQELPHAVIARLGAAVGETVILLHSPLHRCSNTY